MCLVPNFNPRSREGSDPKEELFVDERYISIHAPAKGATALHRISTAGTRFQSTLPRRERPDKDGRVSAKENFNPRSREGSDDTSALPDTQASPFQSTLPRRERRNDTILLQWYTNFNPRSREGSDIFDNADLLEVEYFNPRSREGSDEFDIYNHIASKFISIHAPAKGATRLMQRAQVLFLISIHAPAKGATKTASIMMMACVIISIHAPAKGATKICHFYSARLQNFNPRSREGSDLLPLCLKNIKLGNFNPRSREGSDISSPHCFHFGSISIHAPAKGATEQRLP